MAQIRVEVGDICQLPVEVVVNAANPRLAGAGGMDGAIHRAAGEQKLRQACRVLGGCATGQVKPTPGFGLKARYIFHAVGPVWRGGEGGERELLGSCYRQAMKLAAELEVRSIAFPAISCGVYRFPPQEAAAIALEQVREGIRGAPKLERVIFCCFDQEMADCYLRLLGGPSAPA